MSIHKKKPPTKRRPRPILPVRWVNHSLDPALSRFKQYLPVQRSWQPSDTVSADEMNQNVRDAMNFCLSPPRVHVTMGLVNQTIAAIQNAGVGMTPLGFDTMVVDSDNMWDSNFPSRINFNTPGLYKWRLYVHWQPQNVNGCAFAGVGRISGGVWPIAGATATLQSPKIAEDEQQWNKSTGIGVTNFIEGFYQTFAQDDYIEAFASHSLNGLNTALFVATFTARLVAQN